MLDGKVIGEVTSGTLSPTLGKSIAMAYVDAVHTAEGTAVSADLKGNAERSKDRQVTVLQTQLTA